LTSIGCEDSSVASDQSGIRDTVCEVPNPTLEEFEAALRGFPAAFNARDFAAAWGALPADCEFHRIQEHVENEVLIGPDHVRAYFERLIEDLPDWSIEHARILQAGDGVFVVLAYGKGHGRASGAPVSIHLGSIIELRDGVPFRLREYPTWEQALAVAGLEPSLATEVKAATSSAG
jgi:ketosteroid isomerase-like protein